MQHRNMLSRQHAGFVRRFQLEVFELCAAEIACVMWHLSMLQVLSILPAGGAPRECAHTCLM